MNLAIIEGNLGKKPMVQTLDTGVSKVIFSLACNESYFSKKSNSYEQKTDWLNVEFWTKDPAKFDLWEKGDTIQVQGKNTSSTWENEGQKYYKQFVRAEKATRKRISKTNKLDEIITSDEIPF